jgi:hypothetical protein
MIEDSDLEATLRTARKHLNAGGAFMFDFWYGPAVLRNPPQTLAKAIQVGESCIERRTIPEWDPRAQRRVREFRFGDEEPGERGVHPGTRTTFGSIFFS